MHHSLRKAIRLDVSSVVILTVLSTFSGRILISEIQDECPDLLENDYVKVLALYSMIYLALKGREGSHALTSVYWCVLIIALWKFFKDHLARFHCGDKKKRLAESTSAAASASKQMRAE